MKKLVTTALLVILAASTPPLLAHANDDDPVTPAPRFATFTKIGGSQATGVLPTGFQNIQTTPINDVFRVDAAATNPPGYFGPYWERYLAEGTRPSAFIIPRVSTGVSFRTTTVAFDGLMPADHIGIGLLDVDARETLWVKVLDRNGVPLSTEECGLQDLFNSLEGQTGQMTLDLPPFDVAAPSNDDDYCFRIFTESAQNTSGATFWFVPTVAFTALVLTEKSGQEAVVISIAADRPQPTITPATGVTLPTALTIGDDPISLTPDMFTIDWPEGILPDQFTPDGDFDDTVGVVLRVKDAGDTGCFLTANSPTTLQATSPGTCTLEAIQPERPNFLSASFEFPITVTSPPPPAPKPEPAKPVTPTEWTPETTNFQVTTFPGVIELPPPPPPPGGGAYTFATEPTSTSLCTVERDTPTVTVQQAGTCAVTANIGATKNFSAASVTVEFTITQGPILAATGAPAWPVWAGAAMVAGLTLYGWATFTSRQPARARND